MLQTFAIEGLHCQGCADTVTEALKGLPEVSSVKVDLDTKAASTVEVDGNAELTASAVQQALDAKGNFTVLS
ncbi:MAG: heavy metal-associated domain-containing protein [Mycobacterium sp.]|nr:heavy metal-associated domain-containing protein [Mycobacterium sp.]